MGAWFSRLRRFFIMARKIPHDVSEAVNGAIRDTKRVHFEADTASLAIVALELLRSQSYEPSPTAPLTTMAIKILVDAFNEYHPTLAVILERAQEDGISGCDAGLLMIARAMATHEPTVIAIGVGIAQDEDKDAGNEDAGNKDAGNEDAGHEDAGNKDAGNEDAGNEDADAKCSRRLYDLIDDAVVASAENLDLAPWDCVQLSQGIHDRLMAVLRSIPD
jgi:hypothetical protein